MWAKFSSVSTCSSVARAAAEESALPASVPPTPPWSTRSASGSPRMRVGELLGDAVGADRHAAGDRLADGHDVGAQAAGARAAADAGAEGVRLVVDEQRAGLVAELAHGLEEARLGRHDADVGHRRLHEHAGDVARRERGAQRLDVVELDDLGRLRRVDLRADVARLGHAACRRAPTTMMVSSTRAVVALVKTST